MVAGCFGGGLCEVVGSLWGLQLLAILRCRRSSPLPDASLTERVSFDPPSPRLALAFTSLSSFGFGLVSSLLLEKGEGIRERESVAGSFLSTFAERPVLSQTSQKLASERHVRVATK